MSSYRYKGGSRGLPGVPRSDIAEERLATLATARGVTVEAFTQLLEGSGLYDRQQGVQAPQRGARTVSQEVVAETPEEAAEESSEPAEGPSRPSFGRPKKV